MMAWDPARLPEESPGLPDRDAVVVQLHGEGDVHQWGTHPGRAPIIQELMPAVLTEPVLFTAGFLPVLDDVI